MYDDDHSNCSKFTGISRKMKRNENEHSMLESNQMRKIRWETNGVKKEKRVKRKNIYNNNKTFNCHGLHKHIHVVQQHIITQYYYYCYDFTTIWIYIFDTLRGKYMKLHKIYLAFLPSLSYMDMSLFIRFPTFWCCPIMVDCKARGRYWIHHHYDVLYDCTRKVSSSSVSQVSHVANCMPMIRGPTVLHPFIRPSLGLSFSHTLSFSVALPVFSQNHIY